jgi:hypothetical protein
MLLEKLRDCRGVRGMQYVVVGHDGHDLAGSVGNAVVARRRNAAMRLVGIFQIVMARLQTVHQRARPTA